MFIICYDKLVIVRKFDSRSNFFFFLNNLREDLTNRNQQTLTIRHLLFVQLAEVACQLTRALAGSKLTILLIISHHSQHVNKPELLFLRASASTLILPQFALQTSYKDQAHTITALKTSYKDQAHTTTAFKTYKDQVHTTGAMETSYKDQAHTRADLETYEDTAHTTAALETYKNSVRLDSGFSVCNPNTTFVFSTHLLEVLLSVAIFRSSLQSNLSV